MFHDCGLRPAERKVNFGKTIVIDRLNIEMNLRPRRNLPVDVCGFRGCEEPAIASGIWQSTKPFVFARSILDKLKPILKTGGWIENAEGSSHNSEREDN